MREVVRCGSIGFGTPCQSTAIQVVDICASLGHIIKIVVGCEDIIIYDERTMGDLDEDIALIRVEEILRYANSLGLPVEPDSKSRIMDIVVMDLYIKRRMELYACDLMAEELMLFRDIVDLIVIDLAEYASHVSYDSILNTTSI